MSDSLLPTGLQPTRLLCPWDSPGKNTGVGRRALLQPLSPFSSVAQSCRNLCDPMDCNTPGFPVHHQLRERAQTPIHPVGDAIWISSSVVPFSSCLQSFPASGSFQMSHFFTLGGQNIGSFSFSIRPSNEYSGLISFRIVWLNLLTAQGTVKSLLQHHSSNASILCAQLFL